MKRALSTLALIAVVAGFACAACAGDAAKQPKTAALEVRSSAFSSGGAIPRKHSKEGEDVSPPLEWSGVPNGTNSLALIVDDPDVPLDHPFVHWVAYGIAAEARGLAEGAKDGFVAGKNHFGALGYGGPMPPPGSGPHHYHFKLYALDAPVDPAPGKTKGELLRAMEGHVLATGEIVGVYER